MVCHPRFIPALTAALTRNARIPYFREAARALMVLMLAMPGVLFGQSSGIQQSSPVITGEEIFALAKAQTEFGPRRPGTEAYEQARDHIRGLLEQWGYRVWTDSIPSEQSFAKQWSLEVVSPEGRVIESFPMRHSGPTAPEGFTATLVDMGKGREREFRGQDVAGQVVLVKWGHRVFNLISLGALRGTYARAVEQGAVGYLQFFTNTPDNSYQLMTAEGPAGGTSIPGFSIGKEDARKLQRQLRQGEVELRISLDSEEREALADNVFAVLPGRTDDVILVDTHYCSMFVGAVDNASGVAAALALAHYFSQLPADRRQKTLVFSFYGTHEYVDYKRGAEKFLTEHPELAEHLVAAIGLDHMAAYPDKEYFGHTTRLHLMAPLPGLDQMRGVFISRDAALIRIALPALLKHRLLPFIIFPNRLLDALKFGESEGDSLLDWCICESGPAFRRGVPTFRLMMAPQWYHTRLDTLDRFSPDQLQRVVNAHREIIEAIDGAPPEKFKKPAAPFKPTLGD